MLATGFPFGGGFALADAGTPVPATLVAGSVHVIPEPTTLTLLATGTLGLLGYGWRRRKGMHHQGRGV
jgi:hypothetical protein